MITKDASGQPTGELYNHPAMDMVRRFAPPFTDAMVRQSILDTQAIMAACGVTTVQDNNIRLTGDIKTYQDLIRLRRVLLAQQLVYDHGVSKGPAVQEQGTSNPERATRFSGFKFLLDGQLPTAFCHEQHNGKAWNVSTWEEKSFKNAVRTLHDTGGRSVCIAWGMRPPTWHWMPLRRR